jgi:hypothetical protein
LITTHQQIKLKEADDSFVKELLEQTFQLLEEKPSQEKVNKTLINEPSIDHHWFKFLERYADYHQYDTVKHIYQKIETFLKNLIE